MAPLSAATRRLTVQYGSFTLDLTNQIALQAKDRRYTLRETHQDGYFSCDFVLRLENPSGVEATDDTAFKTLINATETALRKRRQKLTVALNGNVINGNGSGWDPAASVKTAFLIEAECEKLGLPGDTGRRRTYRFSVRCHFPSDQTDHHRDSAVQIIQGVNGRRIALVLSSWTASANSSAYDNWLANAGTLQTSDLLTNVTNGEWVLVSEDPIRDDENATLQTRATYWEVVDGLREYKVDVTTLPNQAKIVRISGLYMTTASKTARQNYTDNVATFAQAILTAEGGTGIYESVSVPKQGEYDTTGKLWRFTHTYTEINYPQGSSADDTNVTLYTLEVAALSESDRQTITKENIVTRLRHAVATYTAVIDKTSPNGTDPYALWDSKFRAYVIQAVQTKLGSLSVTVDREDVRVSLDGNALTATLSLLVRGGTILNLAMRERINRGSSLRPWPVAERPHVWWPYKESPIKILERASVCEVAVGAPKPVVWNPGQIGSGFQFTDTKRSAEEVLDALEQGTLPPAPGWCIFKTGLVEESFPGSRGNDDSFATVIWTRQETWFWVEKWASQIAAPGVA